MGAGRRSRRGKHGVDRRFGTGHVCTGIGGLGGPRVHVCVRVGGLDGPRDGDGKCHRRSLRRRLRERSVRRWPE
eukprot:2735345-Pleurochrysis_carterae.AAC.1